MAKTKDPAAVELGRRGGLVGGRARAEKLTEEQRRESARLAAQARWSAPQATHMGVLRIGEFEIPCFVLSDGRRVLSNGGMIASLGMKRGGYRGGISDRLARFASLKSMNPFISAGLSDAIFSPISFRLPGGQSAAGYEATVLAELCDAIVLANRAKNLSQQQQHIAERAERLLAGFARVGIIALVDEATGYQKERARDELHRLLEAYIRPELRPWQRAFPEPFYDEIFRLKGWKKPVTKGARPKYIGKLTNELVYKQLPAGVLEKLQEQNPVNDKGRRKHKHHQFLTDNIGNPHLRDHLLQVVALLRAAETWKGFERAFRRVFPPASGHQQISLADVSPEWRAHEESLEDA